MIHHTKSQTCIEIDHTKTQTSLVIYHTKHQTCIEIDHAETQTPSAIYHAKHQNCVEIDHTETQTDTAMATTKKLQTCIDIRPIAQSPATTTPLHIVRNLKENSNSTQHRQLNLKVVYETCVCMCACCGVCCGVCVFVCAHACVCVCVHACVCVCTSVCVYHHANVHMINPYIFDKILSQIQNLQRKIKINT